MEVLKMKAINNIEKFNYEYGVPFFEAVEQIESYLKELYLQAEKLPTLENIIKYHDMIDNYRHDENYQSLKWNLLNAKTSYYEHNKAIYEELDTLYRKLNSMINDYLARLVNLAESLNLI